MFASNFPVDSMYGTFDELYDTFSTVTAGLDGESRDKLFAEQRGARLSLLGGFPTGCGVEGQLRHSARLDPAGRESGRASAGSVREKRTGGASMWTSPRGLGAS